VFTLRSVLAFHREFEPSAETIDEHSVSLVRDAAKLERMGLKKLRELTDVFGNERRDVHAIGLRVPNQTNELAQTFTLHSAP
jgi:hypothetical protein